MDVGFGLLLGHLVGDYVAQNDWMAKNKTAPHPGAEVTVEYIRQATGEVEDGRIRERWAWRQRREAWVHGHLACTAHCLLYTLSVWAFSFQWLPWWGLLACFAAHWPIDRFRLARKWMENVSGQREFANGVFAPWSVIVVDNVFHLATLYAIAAVHLWATA